MQTKHFAQLCGLVLALTMLVSACAPAATPTPAAPAPVATQPPAAQPTQAPKPTAVPPTAAPKPTAVPPTAAPAKKGYKIGMLAGVQDPFYFTMQRGAAQAAADLGVELVV